MAQLVKNPLEMGGSLGWEDLLEKEIVTKSSIAWSIRGGILACYLHGKDNYNLIFG